ncbi:N-acetyltransferase, putative [Babesia caballi]|uniref:N-acetyltransferase, putative n=1 Tax=Babesia caballi TaxID=5871 RepID=A0AAV4LWJ0_BABCB|nr:N-acetyltransferase, putative [Babesia caballi]
MLTLRRATIYDLVGTSDCNLVNVIENYQMKYYFYHLLSWPQLTNIAIAPNGYVCGYSMAKLEEDIDNAGHLTAVGVLRSYRSMGIANRVIKQTHDAMQAVYTCDSVYLFVRVSNWGAHAMYKYRLGYSVDEIVREYFNDKEDAYSMKHVFPDGRRICSCNKFRSERPQEAKMQSIRRFASHAQHKVVAPKNAGVVFDSRAAPIRFALPFKPWMFLCFVGFSGAMCGNLFFTKFLLRKNPPNPPRDPNERPPAQHPHTPDDGSECIRLYPARKPGFVATRPVAAFTRQRIDLCPPWNSQCAGLTDCVGAFAHSDCSPLRCQTSDYVPDRDIPDDDQKSVSSGVNGISKPHNVAGDDARIGALELGGNSPDQTVAAGVASGTTGEESPERHDKRIMIPYAVNYPVNHEDLHEVDSDERPEKAKQKLEQLGFFQPMEPNEEIPNTRPTTEPEPSNSYSLTMSTLEPDSKVWECMKTSSSTEQIGTKQASRESVSFQCPSRMDYESIRSQWIIGRARIHWFPRYFGKSLGELSEHIRMCDVILDVRDARIPYVADSDFLLNVYNNMFTHKPKVLVFTHADLASVKGTEEWGTYYRIKNFWEGQEFNRNIPEPNRKPVTPVIFVDAKNGISCIVRLKKLIYKLCHRVNQRRARRGLAPRPLRAIALGMPNVGKSALVNRLLGRHKSRSYNAAGVTRDIRLVRLHPEEYREAAHKVIDVVDTPGVLPANLYNVAFGPAKGKSHRKRNRLLGSMYFNLPQTHVPGGHSKAGIDARHGPIERNVWLMAAANQIVEGAYDNDEAAENLLEQALEVYKRHRSYVELPRILKRIGIQFAPHVLEMHPSDFSHECLQTASHKHHGGDVNAAASRILADFRRGHYGRVTLQTPPAEVPNRYSVPLAGETEARADRVAAPPRREYAQGIYEGW